MSRTVAMQVAKQFNGQVSHVSPNHVMLPETLHELSRMDGDDVVAMEARHTTLVNDMMAAYGYHSDTWSEDKPFAYADGVAFVPVFGMLLNRYRWAWSGATGYDYIAHMLQAAREDDDVKLIVLDINSGGGHAAGVHELAETMREIREEKPILAVVDHHAFSAAYWLASSASHITLTPTGMTGSIGALIMHFDYSAMLEDVGIKIKFIHAGKHKVDGNQFEPLGADAEAKLQHIVDESRRMFVESVAVGRNMSTDVIYATEAMIYTADDALEYGLIDEIAPAQKALRNYLDSMNSDNQQELIPMTTKTNAAPATPEAVAPTEAEIQTRINAEAATQAQAAVKADRERQASILNSEHAKGREKLASHLALNTNMTADEAIATLEASPVAAAPAEPKPETPSADANALAKAMTETGGGAGVTAGEGGEPTAEAGKTVDLLASYGTATGKTFDAKK